MNSVWHTSEFFQVFQSLFLMHISMEGERVCLKECKYGYKPTDTVLTVGKHQGAPWILDQEVVEVKIL